MNKSIFYFQILLFIILISGISYSQNFIESHAVKKTELLYFVPKKEHLAYTNFGFKPVIADLLWLRGVSYFMYHLDRDNDYKYLFGMFEASVLLDPQFKQVYRDTMSLLINDKEHYPEAEKLILNGVREMPQDWEMSYLAGILYAYYIKDEEKSLKYFEKCWGEIPRTKELKSILDNADIMIRSITEKKNDKKGLILYWVSKYESQHNKESRDYCILQVKKYTTAYMAEKLNEIYNSKASEEEKNKIFNDAVVQFKAFYITHKLNEIINVPLDDLFNKVDAFGYIWVFSERESKLYSFGAAHEYLSRKINLLNIKLWEKNEKYLAISALELSNYNLVDRASHVVLKPEYSEFPAIEEVFSEKDNWLKLEFPLYPIYDRKKFLFIVPEYADLQKIDKKFK